MADQQYPFGANFANVQQNVIPNQFSGGQFLLSEPSNSIPCKSFAISNEIIKPSTNPQFLLLIL